MISKWISFWLVAVTLLGGALHCRRLPAGAGFPAAYATEEINMEKYRGIRSAVADCGGVPTLYVNGEPFPAAAYMTYLEENADYEAFARAGYRLFSVPVLFAGRWINSASDTKPFHDGIFDEKGAPDFSTLDASVARILGACPDALIFPRLNLSMPLWWIEENPACTDGTGRRESLYAPEFRETAADMLRTVIDHINESDYASHIVGYQIAGGNTEEWFHFDLNAGRGEAAERAFNEYLAAYYPDCGFSGLPDLSPLRRKGAYHRDAHLALFLEFASRAVADDICYFCTVAKQATGANVVVGTFYGYSLEVTSSLYGTHALSTILNCGNVDFICSPNSYIGTRDPDADWTEMYPADSVRLHGKLCMQECDVRTHLTKLLRDSSPAYAGESGYDAPIWQPLADRAQSISMLKKTFSRQLVKGNGFWWFDMWGGWYDDPALMDQLRQMRELAAASLSDDDRSGAAALAVFVDESAYCHMTDSAIRAQAYEQRRRLGLMGAPYDLYDVSDFEAVRGKYKAVVFLSDLKTEAMRRSLDLCRRERIRYISLSALKKSFSTKELRAFCKANGIHVYCETDDLVYVGGNYLAVHAAKTGDVTLRLPQACAWRELLTDTETGLSGAGDTMTIPMTANETKLFRLERVENPAHES